MMVQAAAQSWCGGLMQAVKSATKRPSHPDHLQRFGRKTCFLKQLQ